MNQQLPRFKSIDVFRAITMLLMVFINDFDAVKNVPEWWKHAPKNADALGFADTIFPAFLFIVGLSIPLAIGNRLKKGDSRGRVAVYIMTRSLALLVMGFFHVNLENYNAAALLPKPVWEILITVAFFLIWLDYPKTMAASKKIVWQGAGVLLLLVMAILYKGGSDGHIVGMRPYWWGILGLIGWSYLLCAGIFLMSGGRLPALLAAGVVFFLLDLGAHTGGFAADAIKDIMRLFGGGALPALTMAGVIICGLYLYLMEKSRLTGYRVILLLSGIGMLALGFAVRPFEGISKIRATPSWVGICIGISLLVFGALVWLVDTRQKRRWFTWIMPAGTSTLTCYLIPYLLYSVYKLLDFRYPAFLNEGTGGFIRSALTAFLVVLLTGWLEKSASG